MDGWRKKSQNWSHSTFNMRHHLAELKKVGKQFRTMPFFLSNGHIQTIIGDLPIPFPFTGDPSREITEVAQVPLDDGDRLVVEVTTPCEWREGGRTVILTHGLTGCSQAAYMIRLALKFQQKGYRVVRVNLRGAGPGWGLARRPYNAGQSEDLREVIHWLNRTHPRGPITAVGFSLGGNVSLKMAGEMKDNSETGLDSVAGVSPPIELAACVDLLSEKKNRLYHWYFIRRMKKLHRQYCHQFPQFYPEPLPDDTTTLRDFDEAFTAPVGGYESADDYYERASAGPLLPEVTIPTLLITSEDDPFVDPEPFRTLPQREFLDVRITPGGGHIAFLSLNRGGRLIRWMDELLLEWVAKLDGLGGV